MKILITGGHMSPALAIVDALNEQYRNNTEIVFVGRKYTNEGEKNFSMEAQEIEKRNIKFVDLGASRLKFSLSIKLLSNIKKVIIGFYNAYKILKKQNPDVILTFGSYVGIPVVLAGWILRKPVYLHEQTAKPGLSAQLMGHMAKKIFVAFPTAKDFFEQKKTIVTGNPIRNQVFHTIRKPFHVKPGNPVIYITGGSMGSHSINLLIEPVLEALLGKYTLIHQVGNVSEYDDYERLKSIRKKLPYHLASRYHLKEHLLTDEIGYVYSVSDMVIGRAGANTFFELIALRKPAILIPLPWSANGEQQRHAEIFQDAGVGYLFDQEDSPANLLKCIDQIINHISQYRDNFKHLEDHYKHNSINLILSSSEVGH